MQKPSDCFGCPLEGISDGFSNHEGSGSNGVAILGEALGWNEYIDGLPFRPQAQAGSKLEEAFRLAAKEMGQPVTRSQFLIYNTVNCHPPGDKLAGMSYEQGAIEHCSKNVDSVVGGFKTGFNKTILALGNIPLKALTGVSGIADEKQSISHLRGFVFQSKYGLVVPSLHPSFIRRGNNHLTPLLVEDLKRALNVARGLYTSYQFHNDYKPPVYQTSPGLDEAQSFYYKVKDNPRACLTYDIETPRTGNIDEDERDDLEDKDITLIQFSIRKGTGIAFPYRDDYIGLVSRLLALPNIKANHNTWNFDNPRLRAKGHIFNGLVHDTMWMWKHFYPKLPRGLQSVASMLGFPFPWKHLYGSQLEYYGCADVDAVQWIIAALPKMMNAKGVWGGEGRGYVNHVLKIHPILERASDVGIPVSEEEWEKVGVDFRERRKGLDGELQKAIPDEIRNIKPRRKDKETGNLDYGYIREPKTVGIESDNYERLSEKLRGQGRNCISFEEFLYRKHNLAYCEFENVVGGVGEKFSRWAVVEPFKPSGGATGQLVKYLKWKREQIQKEIDVTKEYRDREFGGRNPELTGKIRDLQELWDDYEIPKDLKSKKETTNKKELEEMFLNTGDPVLEQVVKIRSLDTNLNNYLPNWKPGKDGRVHTTWGFTAPTGQKDARNPNILNLSKHTEYGNEFRGMVEAPKGYCFVEFDKKSFHVGTLGYCANDKDYIRYSQLDPHSILGSYIDPSILGGSISLRWSDADILVATKEFKKKCKEHKNKDKQHNIDVRQELAKPTVLGNQLELGPKKLQRQNRRFITYSYKQQRILNRGTGLSAEELQDILNGLFPKVPPYKVRVKEKAFIDKYLINEFGFVQQFYDVFTFSFNKKTLKWDRREGEGAREPIAFRVQGCAFGMMDVEVLEMEEKGLCEEFNFCNTIHDSNVFLPEIGKRDRCIEEVYKIMNQPCKYLVNEATGPEGLVIGSEVAVGFNWKGYDEKSNKEGMQEIKI